MHLLFRLWTHFLQKNLEGNKMRLVKQLFIFAVVLLLNNSSHANGALNSLIDRDLGFKICAIKTSDTLLFISEVEEIDYEIIDLGSNIEIKSILTSDGQLYTFQDIYEIISCNTRSKIRSIHNHRFIITNPKADFRLPYYKYKKQIKKHTGCSLDSRSKGGVVEEAKIANFSELSK